MSVLLSHQRNRVADAAAAALLLAAASMAITRLLYEALFPRFLFLGRPLPVFLLTVILTGLAWFVLLTFTGRRERSRLPRQVIASAALSPLLLNLLYLFDPAVDLTASRFLFAASMWLTTVFMARQYASPRQWRRLGILFVWSGLFPLYVLTMPDVAGRADTFEFQVVIPQLGIAHPTGYPLYILLGRLFAALPLGTVAWRINLASAVFATLAATLLYLTGCRLWKKPLPALLAAVLFGLTPTLWSQAVEAEVYALHALFVAAVLWLMAVMLDRGSREENCTSPVFAWPNHSSWQRPVWLLALTIGLGLTNHLTTIILIPASVAAVFLAYGHCLRVQDWRANVRLLAKVSAAFLLPLVLYAYLPLRWQVLHEEAMGVQRFLEWVIGGRFQGALQLTAWLHDVTRYEIAWRLLRNEWGWFNLLLALAGLAFAIKRSWRVALVLLLILAGYIFYALNYYVPDLAVFIIPAHAVITLFWGAGLAGLVAAAATLLKRWGWDTWGPTAIALLTLLFILPTLVRTVENWPDTTHADLAALQDWGEGVLSMPLVQDAALLADSEKIAPLYYLQRAEGQRLDLEIMVLPDEAAYRAEVDARVPLGETVYLARFLPGLEGVYHLRSQGPLIEVSSEPLLSLPEGAATADLVLNGMRLLGYSVEEPAAVDDQATAVTLYWQVEETTSQPQFVTMRWSGDSFIGPPDRREGAHPAGNTYPTVAFRPGEIVPDFHLLPRPMSGMPQQLDLQVALGPQFAGAETLDWHTVTTLAVAPAEAMPAGHAFRAQNGRMLLSQAAFPEEIRPGQSLKVLLGGYAPAAGLLALRLLPRDEGTDLSPLPGTNVGSNTALDPLLYATEVQTELPNGRYHLLSSDPTAASTCGWLSAPSSGCLLGELSISGVALPQDAANFDDKIALMAIDVPAEHLLPGGVLPVQLQWQGLADMDDDYTVFLQLLNSQDQIVGQVDTWPQQGTYPTSQWQPGDLVDDGYEIQLDAELPPGDYRLQIGLYLLGTLRRLPLLDADGRPIDDKVLVTGLVSVE